MENQMNEKIDKAIEVCKGIIPSLVLYDDILKASQAVLNLKQAKTRYVGLSKPTEELDTEIEFVLGRVRPNLGATEIMKVTQAVVNLILAKEHAETAKTPKTTAPRSAI